MAITPAVSPRPTARTNNSAQTSSGILRSAISSQRMPYRNEWQKKHMRPTPIIEIESDWLATSDSGMAINNAKKIPTVAMATVFHVDSAASFRNSVECAGGKNVTRNCFAAFKLDASKNTSGLNSAKYPTGSSTAKNNTSRLRRPLHAGSRHRSVDVAVDIRSSVSSWRGIPNSPAR